MDSSVSETHGAQEGSACNGHFSCTCYHPLFVFDQFGDLERCALRPGNVHSGDAAFANPEVYELMEAEGHKYTSGCPPIRCCRTASAGC